MKEHTGVCGVSNWSGGSKGLCGQGGCLTEGVAAMLCGALSCSGPGRSVGDGGWAAGATCPLPGKPPPPP